MEGWLKKLGIKPVNDGVFDGAWRGNGPVTESISPIDGSVIARIREAGPGDYETAVARALRKLF